MADPRADERHPFAPHQIGQALLFLLHKKNASSILYLHSAFLRRGKSYCSIIVFLGAIGNEISKTGAQITQNQIVFFEHFCYTGAIGGF